MVIRSRAAHVAVFCCGALIASGAAAQEDAAAPAARPDGKKSAKFSAPIRLKAGKAFMGEKRLYPSPVFHDVNGDGLADVVIGDLPGRVTVALRIPGDGPPVYGPETLIKGRDGEDLKFSNW